MIRVLAVFAALWLAAPAFAEACPYSFDDITSRPFDYD